jgi:hypothetical protein
VPETNATSFLQLNEPSRRIEREICVGGGPAACRAAVWLWPARTCVLVPPLSTTFYPRQPLSIRFGHGIPRGALLLRSHRIERNAGRRRGHRPGTRPAGQRLGWFGKHEARFPLQGTHGSRRPASRRSAWPASAVTLRAGAANLQRGEVH